jgi:hypothetical protein
VASREFFHIVGVGHGEKEGEPGAPWADRNVVTTPERALNAADNLPPLAAKLQGGACDACQRAGD